MVGKCLEKSAEPRKQFVRVAGITEHFPGMKTFRLEADGERTLSLAPARAGNYISVTADVGGSRVTRAYTLASSPAEAQRDGFYLITVKKAGILSGFLCDEVAEGDVLLCSAPDGNFVYDPAHDEKVVVGIAGGGGVTSMLSMAKAVAEGSEDFDMVLVYSVDRACEFLFREQLDGLNCPRVKVVYVAREGACDGVESGVVTAKLVHDAVGGRKFTLFACGGDEFYAHLVREFEGDALVAGMKFSKNSVTDRATEEKFFTLTVQLGAREYRVPCRTTETLMVAMERAGLGVLSQCRVGECGFCRSKVLAGDYTVSPSHDKRSSDDIRAGVVHPCCTYPDGDVTLSAPEDSAASARKE